MPPVAILEKYYSTSFRFNLEFSVIYCHFIILEHPQTSVTLLYSFYILPDAFPDISQPEAQSLE